MVNLMEYYTSMTQSEPDLRAKIGTIFKYLKAGDKSFARKTLLALRELIFKKNVSTRYLQYSSFKFLYFLLLRSVLSTRLILGYLILIPKNTE